jgi:surface protein
MKNILKNTKKVSIFILLLFIFTLTINTQVTHADVINNTDFVTTWKTDNTGTSNSTSITIPMVGGPYDVDWNNDGVYDQTGLSGPVTHDFGVAGTYTVRIKDAKQIRFANGGDRRKILSVDQWGTSVWTSMDQAFHGCSNVLVLAIDAPDTSLVTSLLSTFYNATSLSGTGNWNWNTSNVTSMRYTFWGDVNFNGDISSWDTSHVTNMQEMMPYTSSFNRNIGLWDVSSVTRMDYLLYGATNFNQDLSQWDVSNLQNATSIFALASDFDQDLSSWNINNVTSFDSIFDQTSLSTKNYDSILISWSSQNPKSGVLFRDTPTQYCKGQTARQSLIDNYGWTITDGGYGNCSVYIPGTPSSPDLNIVSDSGVSNTDNITNDNTPSCY